jgi:DNA-binding SARP family transcriptional activator
MGEITLAAPPIRVYTFGKFRVERLAMGADDAAHYVLVDQRLWGRRNDSKKLLRLLLCHQYRRAPRDSLLEWLWPETDKSHADRYLNAAASSLRRVLRTPAGESLLHTVRPAASITLYEVADQQEVWVDADAFRALCAEAEQAAQEQRDPLPLLEQAQRLARGEFLIEDLYQSWSDELRQGVNAARQRCLYWLADLYEERGRLEQAEALLYEGLQRDLTDEDMLRRLMRVLASQGKRGAALACYERTKRALAKEEQTPLAATRSLAKRIREEIPAEEPFILENRQPPQPAANTSPTAPAKAKPQTPGSGVIQNNESDSDILLSLFTQFIIQGRDDITDVVRELKKQGMDTGRRRFLREVLGITTVALATGADPLLRDDLPERLSRALAKPSIIDEAFLSQLEGQVKDCWRLRPDIIGVVSSDLLSYILHRLNNVTALLQNSLFPSTRLRLCSLAGELTQIIGWTYYEMHDFKRAEGYYKLSIIAAQEAENPALEAVALGRFTRVLNHTHREDEKLSSIQYARSLASRAATAPTSSWLAAEEALIHAKQGILSQSLKALEQGTIPVMEGNREADPYWTGFEPNVMYGFIGSCYMALDQPENAQKYLQQALEEIRPTSLINAKHRQSVLFGDLAIAYVRQNRLDEACKLAEKVITIVAQSRSPLVLKRILKLRTSLEPWKTTSAVQSLDDQIREALKYCRLQEAAREI